MLYNGTVHEESQIIVDDLEFDVNQNVVGNIIDSFDSYDPSQRNIKKAFIPMEETARKLVIKEDIL